VNGQIPRSLSSALNDGVEGNVMQSESEASVGAGYGFFNKQIPRSLSSALNDATLPSSALNDGVNGNVMQSESEASVGAG
jgi:hypothetical protein